MADHTQNPDCGAWKQQLEQLQDWHQEYISAFKNAASDTGTTGRVDAFNVCKDLKSKLKPAIQDLKACSNPFIQLVLRMGRMSFSPIHDLDMECGNKLRNSVSEISYETAVDTLESYGLGPDQIKKKYTIPSRNKIIRALLKLDDEQLKGITNFGKPVMLIVPPATRAELIDAQDKHKKYPHETRPKIAPESDNEYWGTENDELKVVFADGAPIMGKNPLVSDDLNLHQKAQTLEKIFKDWFGAKMISVDEYMILMMQSLRTYEKETAGSTGWDRLHITARRKMVDNWDDQGNPDIPHREVLTMLSNNNEDFCSFGCLYALHNPKRIGDQKVYTRLFTLEGTEKSDYVSSRPAIRVI